MSWQILLFINLTSAAFREYFHKKIADTIDPWIGFFLIVLFNVLILSLFYFALYRDLPVINPLIALSGVVFVAVYLTYFKAIKYSLSQTILFQSYSLVITIILAAVFLNEISYFNLSSSGLRLMGGIFLAFFSLWLLLSGRKKMVKSQVSWLIFLIAHILLLGVGSFLTLSFSRSYGPLFTILNQTYGAFLALGIYFLISNKKIHPSGSVLKVTFLGSFFSSISGLAFFQAVLTVSAAKFYPLQQLLLVILTMMVGVIFYRETNIFKSQKLTGLIIGFMGVLMLLSV